MSGKSTQIHILFLNHWAKELGGAERSLIDLLNVMQHLAKTTLVTSETGKLIEALTDTAVQSVVIPSSPSIIGIKRDHLLINCLQQWRGCIAFLKQIIQIHRFIKKIKPDIIHANIPKSHLTLFILVLLGFRGSTFFHIREIFASGSLPYLLYTVLYPRHAKTIAISAAVQHSQPKRIQPSCVVIHNGVTIPSAYSPVKPYYPLQFLFLGRVVPWKGCHLLITAFRAALQRTPPGSAELHFYGDTLYWDQCYRAKLSELIATYSLTSVVSLNNSTDDPYSIICKHHVLCMASHHEPFGRVAAEAQSCGLPVIGFATGGLPEVVAHAKSGFLVPEDDVVGLGNAMVTCIRNPEILAQWGNEGRKRAETLFNRSLQLPQLCTKLLGDDTTRIRRF